MTVKGMTMLTRLTVTEDQAAIKWLEKEYGKGSVAA
jgi:hypothetical protein